MSTKPLFLLLLLLLFSCEINDEKRPEGILSPDEMVELMVDVHLVEGARSGVTIMGDSLGIELYYRTVLIKHGLDSTSYQNNFDYYSARPDELDLIFEEVVRRLSVLESELRP